MPQLEKKLYYRMLDVTAWKLIAQQKGFLFEKENKHRALDDTRESIKELVYYLNNIEFKEAPVATTTESKENTPKKATIV